jgi:hypothetical protein
VLEHPDARDLVVRFGFIDVAIVREAHLASLLQSAPAYLGACVLVLVTAHRHAECAHAVMLGRVHHQRTPAASDVEEALARMQHQLAADVVQLLALRLVQRIGIVTEIRAGIHHALVQPEAVEVVGHVVVVADRTPVGGTRVAMSREGVQQAARAPAAGRRGYAQALGKSYDAAGFSADIDILLDVAAGERAEVRMREREEPAGPAHRHFGIHGRARCMTLAGPELHAQRHASCVEMPVDPAQQLSRGIAEHGVRELHAASRTSAPERAARLCRGSRQHSRLA